MSGCEGYNAIARVYDKLNADIDYAAWADFVEKCFDRYLPTHPELVLDLACGTGSMRYEQLLALALKRELPMTLENTVPDNAEEARLYLERIAGTL